MSRDRRYYCVYIMGSLSGTLYIGFSGNLHKRIFQHKFHHFERFTDKYDVTRLLYRESYDDVHKALARETQLKGWSQAKKIGLLCDAIHIGWTWLPIGTHGCVPRAGMLRLRSEARFALFTAPLSMTKTNSILENCSASTTARLRPLPARIVRRSASCSDPQLRGGVALASGSGRRCRG